MTILYRLKRLIKADAHAMVESLEEPKWILAQAIRDMETELEKMRQDIEDKKNRLMGTAKQILNSEQIIDNTDTDIDLAVEEKREDIAKHLIKKLLLNQKNLKLLSELKEELIKDIKDLGDDLAKKERDYDEVLVGAQAVEFTMPKQDAFNDAKDIVGKVNALDHDVELEFLRRLKSNRNQEGEGDHA